MPHYFQTQTNIAALDIGLDIFSKARLIVFLADEFSCFIDIEMACQRFVIILADKFDLDNLLHKK